MPHAFCQQLLQDSREEAKNNGVEVPRKITALRSSGTDQYFMEAEGMKGVWVSGADCVWEAKAKFIAGLVDAHSYKQTAREIVSTLKQSETPLGEHESLVKDSADVMGLDVDILNDHVVKLMEGQKNEEV